MMLGIECICDHYLHRLVIQLRERKRSAFGQLGSIPALRVSMPPTPTCLAQSSMAGGLLHSLGGDPSRKGISDISQ